MSVKPILHFIGRYKEIYIIDSDGKEMSVKPILHYIGRYTEIYIIDMDGNER